MKKLLWIIFILLLLGVGFLYIVKNPTLAISQKILTTLGIDVTTDTPTVVDLTNCASYFDGCNTCMVQSGQIVGCTKMMCETQAQPQCLEQVYTGIDLTNCVSYFDGCNNCSVENGKPSACTLMYCETPSEPKCNQYATGTTTGTVGLANPASVNCTNNSGTLEILEGTGGQYAMCNLPDGTSCEERAYMRGECGATSTGSQVSTGNPGEEPTACTMEYLPVCATVQVECIKAPCPPIEQTFGNKCTMNANKRATFLHDGECTGR